ncbi:MAG: PEP-CTERM sorting domain-containing protein [Rhodocyclaceae bacterium]|nr:PEP-CTERM sorting domain-containing protein [Rhodocyclaceae bacterium]
MKTIRPTVTANALLLSLMLASPLASAAVSYTQGHITGVSDVLNTGTVVVANNLGSGAGAVTVNGVSFGNSMTGLSGMFNGGGDFSNQFTSGSPLDNLLSGLAFQYDAYSSLNLTGLTAGTAYTLQIFLSNVVNATGYASRIQVQGQQYNISWLGSNADYVRVGFTASSASELVSFGNGGTGEPDRMVLNAYALETAAPAADTHVPEPASMLLTVLGLGALGFARRRSA